MVFGAGDAKRVRDAFPRVPIVAWGLNPPNAFIGNTLAEAKLEYLPIADANSEAFASFETLRRRGHQAAIYWNGPTPERALRRRHAAEAIRHRIATLGYFANMSDDGMLISYGELDSEQFFRVAQQVQRILRGGNPAEIPFMETTRFHLRINARTAKALGLVIPSDVRILADEIID